MVIPSLILKDSSGTLEMVPEIPSLRHSYMPVFFAHALLLLRNKAKIFKRWQEADTLRNLLQDAGWTVVDKSNRVVLEWEGIELRAVNKEDIFVNVFHYKTHPHHGQFTYRSTLENISR